MGKSSLLVMLKLLHLMGLWPSDDEVVLLKLASDTINKIKSIQGQHRHVLLLDALDEDPESSGRLIARLGELLKASTDFRRVIITCRTQFFESTIDPFQRSGVICVANFMCPMVYLSPFDDGHVERYLARLYPGADQLEKREKAFSMASRMDSLHCRPMLLANIDYLLNSDIKNPHEYFIFEALVDSWLIRECRKDLMQDEDLSKEHLLEACIYLAIFMEQNKTPFISLKEIDDLIASHPTVRGIKAIDVGGRSLLNRTSQGSFRFSHYSLQEFLAIRRLLDVRATSRSWVNRLTQLQITFLCCQATVILTPSDLY